MQLFVNAFTKGLITRVENRTVPRGGASDSLNWQFMGDRIELRRGQERMGSEVSAGDRVTFVRVARKYDSTQIPFFGSGRKVFYFDEDTQDHIEIGTDMLPADANDEDVAHTLYQSLAGSFLYLSSPNSSVYKLPVANPGSYVDQLMDTFRGYIKAGQGRMFLWNRKDKYGGADKTGLDVSAIDRDSLADYPFTSGENLGTGNGATSAYSGTFAFKATAPKKTVHFPRIAAAIASRTNISAITQAASAQVTSNSHGLAVGDVVVFQDVTGMTQINNKIAVVATVVDANAFTIDIDTTGYTAYVSGGSVGKSELFIDDRSGGLTGSLGGTGTINYATGAYSVTFSTSVTNGSSVVADYYTEDATDGGVLDFDEGDGSSIADSLSFRQDDAGFFQNIGNINATIYCLHTIKTYALRLISSDDITNLPYRERFGIPNWRAMIATGEGIYGLDMADPKNPTVRILEIPGYSAEVKPRSISDNIELSGYLFDKAAMFEWGEYILLACRTQDEVVNNRCFMYHRIWKSWEVHSFRISDMDAFRGALLGGDSGSGNLFKLFSGVADEDSIIENFFITGADDLDMEGIKDLRRMKVAGLIGDDQQLDVSYSVDNEPFVFVTSILGNGAYVDLTQRKIVGNKTLGAEEIGGGQAEEDAIFASPYEYEFYVGTKRFSRIRIKFEAKQVGYCSITEYGFVDARPKGLRLPTKYVQR